MSKDGKVWLSHTALEYLERCPRCFWLQYKKGIRQPEGIVSRLANRFDVVIKKYFDIYRKSGNLPDILNNSLKGHLQNPFIEKYFVKINNNYGFYGKLDECLVSDNDEHIPIDFKTASSDPREKETLSAYQSQIDAYLFLLKEKGKKIADYGYLIYFFPDEGVTLHNGFPMITYIKKVTGRAQGVIDKINHAIDVLEHPMPENNPECVFCKWYIAFKKELENPTTPHRQLSFV